MKKKLKTLEEAIKELKNIEEIQSFMSDLFTDAELNEFRKRWQAAQLLSQDVPYSEIETVTGLSSTTVARVSKWLRSGKGGYRLVLDRLAQ